MIVLHSFYILTHNGESVLSDTIQRQRTENQNSSILFYLDANLCLDIVSYFENKQAQPQSKTNVEILILFCQQYNIEVSPKFGSMELCKESLNKLNVSNCRGLIFTSSICFPSVSSFANTEFPVLVSVNLLFSPPKHPE